MKTNKILTLLALVFLLTSLTVQARTTSTRFSTVTPMYNGEVLTINAGTDIEGYTYLGILVGRRHSSTPNSAVPVDYDTTGAYTVRSEVGGNNTWFVPLADAKGTGANRRFEFNFNNATVRQLLFSINPALVNSGITNNLPVDTRVFSVEWYHVYRTPAGKIVAVGKNFTENASPHRTFIKLGPQVLSINVDTGSHNYESTVNTQVIFSDRMVVKGEFEMTFNGFPQPISLTEKYNSSNVSLVNGTFKFPTGFPELNRTYAITSATLPNVSVKTQTLSHKGTGRELYSMVTGLPPSNLSPDTYTTGSKTNLEVYEHIGDNFDNSIIVDHSAPTINMLRMALTKQDNSALPEQLFDSSGNAITPVWFNRNIVNILGNYTDRGAGPAILSVLGSDMKLLKSGTIPNTVINTPKNPPHRIGQHAVINNQRANIGLSARQIRDSLTDDTLFESEVTLYARVNDMVTYDKPSSIHQAIQSFKAYIDLYPPEMIGATIQTNGERSIVVTSNNAKISKFEFVMLDQRAYMTAMANGKWEDVPEFYLYPDGYNHGANTLEAKITHMFGNPASLPGSFTEKVTETFATPVQEIEKKYNQWFDSRHSWIVYRTEDEIGNVGYGHFKATVISRGAPFLIEIDTPHVNQYFSNLESSNNSEVDIKSRVIDMALADDEAVEINLSVSIYRENNPNTPITGLENINLGTTSILGPRWYELRHTLDLSNYVTNPTDLDGNLIIELKANHIIDESVRAVPGRVPIRVHSVVPNLTHTLSEQWVAVATYPELTVNTEVTSAIDLEGVYNAITSQAERPSFVFGNDRANSSWTKIERIHSEHLRNLNGEIYYHVIVYDKAKNSNALRIGPINMYSDLLSYVRSSQSTSFVGNKQANSTSTLILADSIDNALIHVTALDSDIQLPLINLNVTVTEDGTNRTINTGTSTSTTLELPFLARTNKLDYRKYLADYQLSTGLPVTTPLASRTSEVYTIVDPIQTLFNIELKREGNNLVAKATPKTNLASKVFSNGETLQQVFNNSLSKFGINLATGLRIAVNNPVSSMHARPLNGTGTTLPMTNADFISIGFVGTGDTPDYELRFRWDSSLANIEITNILDNLTQASESFEIQTRTTHLANNVHLPSSLSTEYTEDYKVNIMVIPKATRHYNPDETVVTNWNRLHAQYAKDYFVKANRTIHQNGKYDIIVEVITPFGIRAYDHKSLDLLLRANDTYLASENSQSLLISNSTVYNSLNQRLANHGVVANKSSDVGAYQLNNGDVIVFSKIEVANGNTLLEVYDSQFNLVSVLRKDETTPIKQVHDVLEVKNLIFLGTNDGLFRLYSDYIDLEKQSLTESTQIFQLERYNDSILFGADDVNTLQLVNVGNNGELTLNSVKTSQELFGDDTKRVRQIQVRNSTIYVSYDRDTLDAVKYVILE